MTVIEGRSEEGTAPVRCTFEYGFSQLALTQKKELYAIPSRPSGEFWGRYFERTSGRVSLGLCIHHSLLSVFKIL